MGKRPDQYQIDPSEGGATDYKNLPQTGRGNTGHLDTTAIDKQQLAQSKKNAEGQPVPPDVPAPSVHTKRGTKLTDDDQGGADNEGVAAGDTSS
jgi:hypothetical protein